MVVCYFFSSYFQLFFAERPNGSGLASGHER
jgi:hypothetical protein